MRGVASRYLTAVGHGVVQAENGVEAWDRYCEAEEGFDLVITDIQMPEMDGLELAARIRQVRPDQLFLFISGERNRIPDGENRLYKPFELSELVEALSGLE